jgi:1-deoxy-D-xylulose-5-phosphate synthase
MILEKINYPQDLKSCRLEELKILSDEIRKLIVDIVALKGGHLASSLGAVELCIALHYCFNTPYDTLIFDVGHQTYAHKIITGRKSSFGNLREYKGISGFPDYRESPFDVYISGHASTAVSWAQGIAEAKKLKGEDSRTVAVIGDGSLTGGMCFEALNNCGHAQSDVLIIFNHNEMSISRSVGALSSYLTKIISAPVYNRIKSELESFLKHFSLGKKLTHRAKRFEEAVKGLITPGIFFEELGFRYFGPIDGHSLDVLIPTLRNISALRGTRLLHIITKKGKGYRFSEDNPEDFHSVAPFDKEKGIPLREKRETFSEIFANTLVSLAKENKKIVAITAAMPKGTGLNIFKEEFPDRFFDVGIAEAHAVGFASGLAKQGVKPVVAIYSTFLQRAFDQIIHDVALQNLGVVFVLDRAGIVGEDGPTHQGVFDISYLRLIPNIIIMAPKDKEELKDMLEFALGQNVPVSIRYPKGEAYLLSSVRGPLDKTKQIQLGKGEVLCEGKDLCMIALGSMVKVGLQCVDLLKEEGITVFLINARFVKPLDKDLLRGMAKDFKLIVTLEEGTLKGGFGSAVLEFYERENLLEKVKVIREGLPDEFISAGKREELLKIYGLDPFTLKEKIKVLLKSLFMECK